MCGRFPPIYKLLGDDKIGNEPIEEEMKAL
jgi:hypothetical protein